MTIVERQALGNLLKVLQKQGGYNPKWIQYIEDYFAGTYYRFRHIIVYLLSYVKKIPRNGKREIIRGVLTGWNEHHSHLILHESINSSLKFEIKAKQFYAASQRVL